MKRIKILLFCLLCFSGTAAFAQNAPKTYAGSSINAVPGATVTIPITVSGFMNIGAFTLTLDYNPSVLQFVSATPNGAFSGWSCNGATPGRVSVGWFGPAVTLPEGSQLYTVTFQYISGTSPLTWYDNGGSCEYSDGNSVTLNDSPKASYYFNGIVTNQASPVTIAPVITNATPGAVAVPITVNKLSNVGAISLTLEYDPDVMAYVGNAPNSIFPAGTFVVGDQISSNGKRKIVMGYFGPPVIDLEDSSVLVTLNFMYTTANGRNFSELRWLDDGGSCEYADQTFTPLWDMPYNLFYINGLVSGQLAPGTFLPIVTNAIPGALTVPVSVNGFSGIGAISLKFDYDPAVITYQNSYAANGAFTDLIVGIADLPNGKKRITIGWFGNPVTLADGESLVNLNFTYLTGITTLQFYDDGNSCEYANGTYCPLYDLPQPAYYHDGLIGSKVAPQTEADTVLGVIGQQVTVPVFVRGFTDIKSYSLFMLYDPGVLTFQSITPVGTTGGTWSASGSTSGQINIGWFTGDPVTLAENAVLYTITFSYLGGSTPITWYDNGGSCEYGAGTPTAPLWDKPQATYYINGFVGPEPLKADFTASDTLPEVNETIQLTDLSLGGPLTWSWVFTGPGSAVYDAGSNTSQHPQVHFTVNGKYSASLTVTNASGTNSVTKTFYLHVGCDGCWTGILSTDWYTEDNWDNYLVPRKITNVTLPTSAPYWPDHLTDFILGTRCTTITMVGNAELNVRGNFTISPGASLTFTGSGIFRLSGDWINTGTFNCGTGTVVFIGTGSSQILPGINTFYNFMVLKGDAVVTNHGNITVLKDVTIH